MSIRKIVKKLLMHKVYYGKNRINSIGENVSLPYDIKILGSGRNVNIGSNVSLGYGPIFMCTNAKINIADHVVASYKLTIITGDHERRVGVYCNSITEAIKNHNAGLDQDVNIESDVWLGINATLLKGVTIGRGTTVCAGAVVNKSMPPYCICGGVPAKVIKFYWTIDEILEHESKLYPEDERFTRKQLEVFFAKYQK